jgi:ABC-2 type transport system ATP-binding protein
VTIFISTAYLDEAERCNRVALIDNGKLLACGTPDDVKKLMRGAILEIRCEQPRQASAVLKEKLTGVSVGLFGDRVHVVSRESEQQIAATANRLLSDAGLSVAGIRQIEPTLEDVFVSVLAEKEHS